MSEYAIQKVKFNKDVSLTKIKKHCLKLLGRKKDCCQTISQI